MAAAPRLANGYCQPTRNHCKQHLAHSVGPVRISRAIPQHLSSPTVIISIPKPKIHSHKCDFIHCNSRASIQAPRASALPQLTVTNPEAARTATAALSLPTCSSRRASVGLLILRTQQTLHLEVLLQDLLVIGRKLSPRHPRGGLLLGGGQVQPLLAGYSHLLSAPVAL